MRQLFTVLTGVFLSFAGAVQADDTPVVLELYTSQGCSSCPPADETLAELAKSDDVIALALHVDYWDYLGWEDQFADPQFTKRQKAYAKAVGKRMIYTPQLVIAGQDHVIGSNPAEVAALIRAHSGKDSGVALSVSKSGDTLTIRGTAEEPARKPMMVQLVRYHDGETVAIQRGENAGREISYANIVTEWNMIERWDGRKPLVMTVKVPGKDSIVVIVQRADHGEILAATRLR